MFIAFEGGEGSGKSTQARLLADWLRAEGHLVLLTRQPGGTPLGAQIRSILLDDGPHAFRAEVLLFAADRAQHAHSVLRPALAEGKTVVTDRYIDSSLAYQGALPEGAAEVEMIEAFSTWAAGGLLPDLTIVLDIDPAIGLARASHASGADTIESRALAYHRKVRAKFLDLARDPPRRDRYAVVNADRPQHLVHSMVRALVDGALRQVTPAATSRPA